MNDNELDDICLCYIVFYHIILCYIMLYDAILCCTLYMLMLCLGSGDPPTVLNASWSHGSTDLWRNAAGESRFLYQISNHEICNVSQLYTRTTIKSFLYCSKKFLSAVLPFTLL